MKVVETDVVTAIVREVAAQVGELRFNLWFRDNAKLKLTNDELVVGVPNLFFKEWLECNFKPALKKASQAVLGRRLPIRVIVDGELFRRNRSGGRDQPSEPQRAEPDAPERRLPTECLSRPEPTLQNFIVGHRNRLAYTAARQVADDPNGRFNPLLIYGRLGVGKTHLLRGIAHHVRQRYPGLRVLYITAEAFTNAFLEAMWSKRYEPFRNRVRGADVLLVDDIQFFASKKSTQRELLHTFESLDANGRQVVMSAERHPRQINGLCDKLVNRLLVGMICQLEPPDFETRVALLESRADQLGLRLRPDVLEFIATNVPRSAAELIGAVNSLKAYAAATQRQIDLDTVHRVLGDLLRTACKSISCEQVEQAVCKVLGLTAEQLRSRTRSRSISYPRMLAMYLMRKHTHASYGSIGEQLGGRNHSTVMSAERKVEKWLSDGAVVELAGRRCNVADMIGQIESELQ